MGKQLLFIFLCSFSLSLSAQDSIPADLSSPYAAVRTHLYYLGEDHYNESLAAAPFEWPQIPKNESIEKAIKLKQILDGAGIYIYMDEVPKAPNYRDTTRNKSVYVLTEQYPDVYLEKKSGVWKYSRSSLDAIDDIHDQVYPFGTYALLTLLPKLGTKKILGLYLYQYIGILILSLICVVTHKVFSYFFEQILTRTLLRFGYAKLADHFLMPVAKPISIFVIILLLQVFLPVLQLNPAISHWVMLALKVFLPLAGTIVFYRIVDVLAMYLEYLAKKSESTLDDQLVPLVRKTLKAFVITIGTLFILQNLNIPIIPLLTGLSIGGLAFALAAQDTIKNFFGSLMIFIDRPFQIGDWITSGDIDGSVEEVGFRSSRIRTFRDSVMYVPNSKLADSMIDNHGMRRYRRFFTQIAVTYDTPPAVIEKFVEGLKTIVENHPDTRKDYYNIYFNEMASFSLNIMFYIFFQVSDWSAELKARHEILLEVMKLGKSLGVNFAFPTQTLHMENFPGQPSLSPEYAPENDLDQKLAAHFNNKK